MGELPPPNGEGIEKILLPPESILSFDLLDSESEAKLLRPHHPLPPIPETRVAAGKKDYPESAPTLRSISLPKPPLNHSSSTEPAMKTYSSVAELDESNPSQKNDNSALPIHNSLSNSLSINMDNVAKKPKKAVGDYYKKQNELLENFKNDSEQIQVFQKTRTRNRLQSTASTDVGENIEKRGGDEESGNEADVPLLKHIDDDSDMDAVAVVGKQNSKADSLAPPENVGKNTSLDRSHDSVMMKHEAAADKAKATSKAASRLALITLFVNISLMVAKAVASYLSGSLSIISSLVDSCVDITSGLVISVCTRMIKKRDPYLYPRGRTRLEPLSLIIISVVMGVASVQLIYDAIHRIVTAYRAEFMGDGEMPKLEVSWTTVGIMVATVAIKLTLFTICQKYKSDPSIEVLAQDHRNDCLSNTVALACAWLAQKYWYYLDPLGAILVSVYILWTWVNTGREHLSKLSGKSAKPEFINRIIKVCIDHDPRISHLDTVYVYHYGTKFLVEVHIVLDENMPLKVAHDISESLQINIESLPEVERAFVHTDYEYEHQPGDEHKVV